MSDATSTDTLGREGSHDVIAYGGLRVQREMGKRLLQRHPHSHDPVKTDVRPLAGRQRLSYDLANLREGPAPLVPGESP